MIAPMPFKYHKQQQHLQDSQLLNHSKTLVQKIIQLRHIYVGEGPVMVNMSGCLEVEGPYLSPHPPLFINKQLYRLKRNHFVCRAIQVKLRAARLAF